MEVKILEVTTQGIQPVVKVGFFDGENQVHEKRYFLDPGQTVDDIKPQIKEDLDRISDSVSRAKVMSEQVGETVDLDGVKSISELRAEEEASLPEEEK